MWKWPCWNPDLGGRHLKACLGPCPHPQCPRNSPTQPPPNPWGPSLLSWSFFGYQPLGTHSHTLILAAAHLPPIGRALSWTFSIHSCFWPNVAPGNGAYSPSPVHAQARIQALLSHSPSPSHNFHVPVHTTAYTQQGGGLDISPD